MNRYLQETALLDFTHTALQNLIKEKQWNGMGEKEKILSIYNFVRDEIGFGFNTQDTLSASTILPEGYGQCNTKAILFMALLRGVGVPCRLHGFTVDKNLQAGIMVGKVFDALPDEIMHTWTEVYFEGRWFTMEGLILDVPYLTGLQKQFVDKTGDFSGYGVASSSLRDPQIYWYGDNDTYIQREGIVQDFGVFDDPDSFFSQYSQGLNEDDAKLFANVLRHTINEKISEIREQQPTTCGTSR